MTDTSIKPTHDRPSFRKLRGRTVALCSFTAVMIGTAVMQPVSPAAEEKPDDPDIPLYNVRKLRLEIAPPPQGRGPIGDELAEAGVTEADIKKTVVDVLEYSNVALEIDRNAPYTLRIQVSAVAGEGADMQGIYSRYSSFRVTTGTQRDFGPYEKRWVRVLLWERAGSGLSKKETLREDVLRSAKYVTMALVASWRSVVPREER